MISDRLPPDLTVGEVIEAKRVLESLLLNIYSSGSDMSHATGNVISDIEYRLREWSAYL